MFSLDRFHPSAAGYKRTAQALLPSLLAALGEAREVPFGHRLPHGVPERTDPFGWLRIPPPGIAIPPRAAAATRYWSRLWRQAEEHDGDPPDAAARHAQLAVRPDRVRAGTGLARAGRSRTPGTAAGRSRWRRCSACRWSCWSPASRWSSTTRTAASRSASTRSVLIFLLCTFDARAALAVWGLAVVATQLLSGKRPAVQAFNIGVGVVGRRGRRRGAALRARIGRSARRASWWPWSSPRRRTSSSTTCSRRSRSRIDSGTPLRGHLVQPAPGWPSPASCPFDLLGYLAAVVLRSNPWWTLSLLVVPLVTLLVATRAITRGRENAAPPHRAARGRGAGPGPARARPGRRGAAARRPSADPAARRRGAQLAARGRRDRGAGTPRQGRALGGRPRPGPGPVDGRRRPARARRAGRALRRRLRPAAADRRHGPLRAPRPPDRPAQPRHPARPGRARPAPGPPPRRPGGAAVRRPRRLQAGQRPLRPRRRRRRCWSRSARRLVAATRDSDTVARLGGDEFAVLLEDVTIDRGRRDQRPDPRLARPAGTEVAGTHVTLGASIGIAYGDGSESGEALLRQADLAMYEAKGRGKAQYVAYEPSIGRARLEQARAGRGAARSPSRRGDLRVVYQPVVVAADRADRRRRGAGPLAARRRRRAHRRLHPHRRGDRPGRCRSASWSSRPSSATPPRCGRQRAVRSRSASTSRPASCASPRSWSPSSGAVRAMGRTGLVLEITERQGIGDDPEVIEAMRRIAELGVRFAIDDFGVGFSSISYLHELPGARGQDRRHLGPEHRPRRARPRGAARDRDHGRGARSRRRRRGDRARGPARTRCATWCGAPFVQGFLLYRPMPIAELLAVVAENRRRADRSARRRPRTRASCSPPAPDRRAQCGTGGPSGMSR